MKKIALLTLAAFLITGAVASCKKGEDDPFLSLRSRKARLAGEWTLTKMEGKETDSSGGISTVITKNFTGSALTTVTAVTVMGTTVSSSDTTVFSRTYTFEKNGTYSRIGTGEDGITSIEGTWIFAGKSKKNELKKKEAILLTVTSSKSTGTTSYTGLDGEFFVLKQLKKKEMVITTSESVTSGTSVSTSDYTYTFSKN
jgi:hypothetical protein